MQPRRIVCDHAGKRFVRGIAWALVIQAGACGVWWVVVRMSSLWKP
jgi:hypothetical protein